MNIVAKERLIARISWGYIPATVSTQDGKLVSLLLHPPTPKEQAQAALVYETEIQRGSLIGLPHEDELLQSLVLLGQWSSDEEEKIEGVQKDIQTIRRGLLDLLFNLTKLEAARSLLRRAEKVLIELLSKRHNLLQNSAEAHAEMCQQRFLIGQITEKEDGQHFWSTKEEFDGFSDTGLINQLCEAFFHTSRVSISSIRSLAKSQQWKTHWEIAKNTNDLFYNPVSAWSLNQRELAYWSTIYDSVYSAFERPSSDIIADDDLLDSWFIRQGEKIEGSVQKNTMPKSNKSGRNEEFIIADQAGAKKIYKMNDPVARAQIRARQKLLERKGTIREQDMPDSQNEMRQQLMEKQRKHVKSISSR